MTDFLKNPKLTKELKEFDIPSLRNLAEELRLKIIDSVIECGGHLSSSLGAVELIIALHYVFDLPKDKVIFDVGHQAYAHKLLTGRAENFEKTLRRLGGVGAFLKRTESEYDTFTTGHAGNSLSLGMGMARARDIKGEKHEVISVVGDSSLTNGLNFEAMNDCGSKPTKHIVVLNDNNMSISKAVGAVSSKLTTLRQNVFYKKVKNKLINVVGVKENTANFYLLRKFKNSLKYMFTNGVLFEEFGYKYFGPVDGHDLEELINCFRLAKLEEEPVIIHVVTKKGKGCKEAENQPDVFHGISSLIAPKKEEKLFYSDFLGKKLTEMAKKDSEIVAICAGMPDGTGLKQFQNNFPKRFFDVGIAEEHAVSMASGFACGGLKPYVSIYSTFLQRSFDQLIHDVAIQKLPVRICVDRAGISGEDGETHQGVFDISFLSMIPGVQIWAPANFKEFERMLELSLNIDNPLVIRYPKGYCEGSDFGEFKPGKWGVLTQGKHDVTLIASGPAMLSEVEKAKIILKSQQVEARVVNASTVSPIDEEFLSTLSNEKVVVIEDNVKRGGLGEAISSFVIDNKISAKLKCLNLASNFIPQGKISELQEKFGLSGEKIANKVLEFIKIQ